MPLNQSTIDEVFSEEAGGEPLASCWPRITGKKEYDDLDKACLALLARDVIKKDLIRKGIRILDSQKESASIAYTLVESNQPGKGPWFRIELIKGVGENVYARLNYWKNGEDVTFIQFDTRLDPDQGGYSNRGQKMY